MAKQTYRVTGEQPVVPPGSDDQFVKGDEFTADLDEPLERALVEAGAIEVVKSGGTSERKSESKSGPSLS